MSALLMAPSECFSEQIKKGEVVPAFALTDLEGKQVTLEQILNGKKAVLINFWATWCPSCRREIPQLMELEKKWQAESFSVVGIDVGESPEKVRSYKDKNGITYPILLDGESKTSGHYGVVGLPMSFLLDSKGRLIGQYHEYSDELAADVEKTLT